MPVYRLSEKPHRPLGATHTMMRSRACMQRHVTGVGHVMRHDVSHVCDETSGVGPGLGGCRDGFGTERRTSHNNWPIKDAGDTNGGGWG